MMGRLTIACFLYLFQLAASLAAPIQDAAKAGDIVALGRLLEDGADANSSDGLATPLFYAVEHGHSDAVKLLRDHGASPNAQTIWGPPLVAAAARQDVGLIDLRLSRGADPDGQFNTKSALQYASEKGCLTCEIALVGKGADTNHISNVGQTALHLAKREGHTEIASYLMARGAAIPTPPSISAALIKADAGRGKNTFNTVCSGRHFVEPGKGRKDGPDLWGVVGSPRATRAAGGYSRAMLSWKGNWTFDDLSVFLYAPMQTLPGTFMEMAGVPDVSDRADIIAYLATLRDYSSSLSRQ